MIADEHGGKLPNRVMLFADEIGTIPKVESMEMMFSAGRSRRISMVPIIQSFAQLEKNYGKEGSSIIIDNCQDILFVALPLIRKARKSSPKRWGTGQSWAGLFREGSMTRVRAFR